MHQMRTRWPEEELLVFLAFDLLHRDGVDLRSLSSANATSTDCASRTRPSSNRSRRFQTARLCSTIATNLASRVSFPSAGTQATRAARAATG
jgi:hypothetical protein